MRSVCRGGPRALPGRPQGLSPRRNPFLARPFVKSVVYSATAHWDVDSLLSLAACRRDWIPKDGMLVVAEPVGAVRESLEMKALLAATLQVYAT